MNVLFAINEAFVPGLITAAVSFCANNPGHHRFYVMHDGLGEKAEKKIKGTLSRFDCEVFLVDIGEGEFSSELYTSLPRYYSQSINRLLPQLAVDRDVDRLLYLDADLVVNGSLKEFYETDFGEAFLAAPSIRRDGQDGGPYSDQEVGVYELLKIELKPSNLYFNSGVLLMNLTKFRSIGVSFYDGIVKANQGRIVFADQDILNLAFEGKVVNVVDRRLNCTIPDNMRLRHGEYRWIRDNVKVLHFVVARKPWMPMKYRNRVFRIYMRYFKLEGHPLAYILRYAIWYLMKPIHFLAHCWRKGLPILRGRP